MVKPRYKIPAKQYWAIHAWVRRNKTKTNICCLCKKNKVTWWANISREYKRDLLDFQEMCLSCHRQMDYTDNWRKNVSNATKGEKNPFYGKKHTENTKLILKENAKKRIWERDDKGHFKKLISN